MLPNLLVIGAQKCGTTSLHYYLSLHPEIEMSKDKEIHFFSANWDSGVEWYQSHFVRKAKIIGESSTSYTFYPIYKDVPQRILSTLGPDVKLLYIVRDPIERIVSQYVHDYNAGRYEKKINEALRDSTLLEKYNYIQNSKYYMQLQQYLKIISISNFRIINLRDLKLRPEDAMSKVFSFIGVNESFSVNNFSKILHKSSDKRKLKPLGMLLSGFREMNKAKRFVPNRLINLFRPFIWTSALNPEIDNELRQMLTEQIAPDARAFRNLTGIHFSDWSV